jgi:hypothetical protein
MPVFYHSTVDEKKNNLRDSFAAICMVDLGTQINLKEIKLYHLEDFALPILAHEIGHHVLLPGNLADLARLVGIVKPIFNDSDRAIYFENLFSDIIINDRLYSKRHLPMDKVYLRFKQNLPQAQTADPLWTFYMRVYETLWRLPRGTLAGNEITKKMDIDAGIAVRILVHFSQQPFLAIKRLAYVFLPYFPEQNQLSTRKIPVLDSHSIGNMNADDLGKIFGGMTSLSDDESQAIDEDESKVYDFSGMRPPNKNLNQKNNSSIGQRRTPAQFGQILEDLGLKLPPNKIAMMYYRELANPYLIPFPSIPIPSGEEIMEGAEVWTIGEDLEKLSWELSLFESPLIFPGITTRQQSYGVVSGKEIKTNPIYLDLYIDCSGSMPNPFYAISYLTLAGVIMSLSAIRAGAKVQATIWSDYGTFKSTQGFFDDETRVLEIVTDFISGGTGFPLNILRETYNKYSDQNPPAHIMVISDEGVDTMLLDDELKTHGKEIVKKAFEKGRGGGTLALNLPQGYSTPKLTELQKLGFEIKYITDWKELLDFARDFSEKKWGKTNQ